MRKLVKDLFLRNNTVMQSLRSRLPPVNSLVAFEASARHLSFTKASKELLISREAVSRQIRILENYLGLKLFNRLYRALELTKEGEKFKSVVCESLENIALATGSIENLKHTTKIAITGTIAITSFWLTPRLPKFHDKFPDLEIRVHVSDALPDMIAEGIDIGFRYGHGNWPGYKSTYLFDVEAFPICSPEYLKNAGPLNSPSDLMNHTLLHLHGHHADENWSWWMSEFDLELPTTIRSFGFDSYASVIQAALDGQGIFLGFSQILDNMIGKGLLVRPIEHACMTSFSVYLIVPNGKTLTPNVKKFADWIIKDVSTGAPKKRKPVVA